MAAMTYRINWKAEKGQESHPEWDNGRGMRDGKFGGSAYYGKTEGHTWEFFSHEKATEMVENLNVEYSGKIHHWMETKLSVDIAYAKFSLKWHMDEWYRLAAEPDVPLNHGSCQGCQRGDCQSIKQMKENSLGAIAQYRGDLERLTS